MKVSFELKNREEIESFVDQFIAFSNEFHNSGSSENATMFDRFLGQNNLSLNQLSFAFFSSM